MAEELSGLFYQVPNDIWNGNLGTCSWEGGSRTLEGIGSERGTLPVESDWILVDGRVRIDRIYGSDRFTVYRLGRRQIGFMH